jgi:hypothetical protein
MTPVPRLGGSCHCGNIAVSVELTRAPGSYHPRACDCDFCRKHGAAWVSDPRGSLLIEPREERDVGRYTQGAGIAEMILCRTCGVLIAALWQEQRLYGVVNASVLDARDAFAAAQAVAPKELPPDEKRKRWQSLWFSEVTLTPR